MGFVAGRGEEVKWPVQWSYSGGLMWRGCYKNKREDGGWAGRWGGGGVFRGNLVFLLVLSRGKCSV